jgi:hypothetical protein
MHPDFRQLPVLVDHAHVRRELVHALGGGGGGGARRGESVRGSKQARKTPRLALACPALPATQKKKKTTLNRPVPVRP